MTDTTIETPRRPFAVRDAIPLVLGLGLFATGALLFVLDIASGAAFGIAFVGTLSLMLFIHRENQRKGLPNNGVPCYGSRHHSISSRDPMSLNNPANMAGFTNPNSQFNPASPNWFGRQ